MATLRRAVPADAVELVRLRALMHQAMGTSTDDPDWWRACREAFARRLAQDPLFVAFVIVEDAGQAISCGAGWVEEHLPSPLQHDGRRGHIASMSTEPGHRRHGHGRAVFEALMGWMREQGLARVDLRATEDGRRLYEQFGFRELGGASMAWTAPGVRPGMPRA